MGKQFSTHMGRLLVLVALIALSAAVPTKTDVVVPETKFKAQVLPAEPEAKIDMIDEGSKTGVGGFGLKTTVAVVPETQAELDSDNNDQDSDNDKLGQPTFQRLEALQTAEDLSSPQSDKRDFLPGLFLELLKNLRSRTTLSSRAYFNPGAYGPAKYTANPKLLGYSQLAVAYALAAFKPNVAHTNDQWTMPVSPGTSEDPQEYCKLPADSYTPRKALYSQDMGSLDGATSATLNAQIFALKTAADVTLVTCNIGGSRVSMSPKMLNPFALLTTIGTVEEMWHDWVGTDFSMQTMPDTICNKPGAKLQAGYANYWLKARDSVLSALKEVVLEVLRSEAEQHKVEVMFTGYSLGGAVAELMIYDANCNGFFDAPEFNGMNVEQLGAITLGTPAFTFTHDSRHFYTDTVPLTKRLQLQDCHGDGDDVACDLVTCSLAAQGYQQVQPTEAIQAVKRDATSLIRNCKGFSQPLCHLLDGYINGVKKLCDLNHDNICRNRCVDKTLADQVTPWHDSDGATYDCTWYASNNHCSSYGDSYANEGVTANQACCSCGAKSSPIVTANQALHQSCAATPTGPDLLPEWPAGHDCEHNYQCKGMACARNSYGTTAKLQCCASEMLGTYAPFDYCYEMADGTSCASDAMCASGHCSGGSLFRRGHCSTAVPTAEPTAEPTVVPTSAAANSCFPAGATVVTPQGKKPMSELKVGDRVLSRLPDGTETRFDEVYMFGHAEHDQLNQYTQLMLSSGASIKLSGKHFIHTATSASAPFNQAELKYAQDVLPGDWVWEANNRSQVIGIGRQVLPGAFNPYTKSGNIVVDGVVASSHSEWFLDHVVPSAVVKHLPSIYQSVLVLNRMLHSAFGPAAAEALGLANIGTTTSGNFWIYSWPAVAATLTAFMVCVPLGLKRVL